MKNDFYCKVENKRLNSEVCRILKDSGVRCSVWDEMLTGAWTYLYIEDDGEFTGRKNKEWKHFQNGTEVSPDDFIVKATEFYRDEIKIGNDTVVFKDDGIQVGCQFVYKKTVKKIYDKLYGGKE